jgi:hypothetical protein
VPSDVLQVSRDPLALHSLAVHPSAEHAPALLPSVMLKAWPISSRGCATLFARTLSQTILTPMLPLDRLRDRTSIRHPSSLIGVEQDSAWATIAGWEEVGGLGSAVPAGVTRRARPDLNCVPQAPAIISAKHEMPNCPRVRIVV